MKKVTLLVLDETERSILVEALHNFLNYYFPVHLFQKVSPETRELEFLSQLKMEYGGFKLETSENNIYFLGEALQWNSKFIDLKRKESLANSSVPKHYMDEYKKLSYILTNRSKEIYLFGDFDPKQYALNTQLKDFPKYDFTAPRLFLIRFEKGKMEWIQDFYRYPQESDEQYFERSAIEVDKANAFILERSKDQPIFLDMKYQAILFSELKNYKLKKEFKYL